ncbi:hypothetical protein [Deinococcus humi]|uniref:Uncharacterized protein n=1 Tax=Deinococcus humi TaxID=662880 RepID=A0A7W8JXF2_9DEIO|nr:hypothetical protein [Deinococcus humi]MBB5364613.1 hypothetical protein [Deinococcus humi]GGO39182.1 hypothetical protein GCM10008949_46870 [Deinococcus humi]
MSQQITATVTLQSIDTVQKPAYERPQVQDLGAWTVVTLQLSGGTGEIGFGTGLGNLLAGKPKNGGL